MSIIVKVYYLLVTEFNFIMKVMTKCDPISKTILFFLNIELHHYYNEQHTFEMPELPVTKIAKLNAII